MKTEWLTYLGMGSSWGGLGWQEGGVQHLRTVKGEWATGRGQRLRGERRYMQRRRDKKS